jgi:hypothetical protein
MNTCRSLCAANHFRALLAPTPRVGGLHAALEWLKTQDASTEFQSDLDLAVSQLRTDLDLDG